MSDFCAILDFHGHPRNACRSSCGARKVNGGNPRAGADRSRWPTAKRKAAKVDGNDRPFKNRCAPYWKTPSVQRRNPSENGGRPKEALGCTKEGSRLGIGSQGRFICRTVISVRAVT